MVYSADFEGIRCANEKLLRDIEFRAFDTDWSVWKDFGVVVARGFRDEHRRDLMRSSCAAPAQRALVEDNVCRCGEIVCGNGGISQRDAPSVDALVRGRDDEQ